VCDPEVSHRDSLVGRIRVLLRGLIPTSPPRPRCGHSLWLSPPNGGEWRRTMIG